MRRPIALSLLLAPVLGVAQISAPCDVSVAVTQPTCPGLADGAITVATVSGGPFTYAWDHDPNLIDATANNLIAGLYTVQVTGFDCDTLIDVVVNDPFVPPLGSLAVTNLSCAGNDDGALTLSLANGGPFVWFWTHYPTETATTFTDLPIALYVRAGWIGAHGGRGGVK